jgi:alpha-glucosidase
VFLRHLGDERVMVALNLSDEPAAVEFTSASIKGRVLLSSHLDRQGEETRSTLNLRSHEGVVLKLTPESVLHSRWQ